jgi:hypothetical protein
MLFTDIKNVPADGATFLLHINKQGQCAMYSVGSGGKLGDMKTGPAYELLLDAVRAQYPNAEVKLNESDRAGPRTDFLFYSWGHFCEAFKRAVTGGSGSDVQGIIARYIWFSTTFADGLCEDDGEGGLKPTERGLAADKLEVKVPEETEVKNGST